MLTWSLRTPPYLDMVIYRSHFLRVLRQNHPGFRWALSPMIGFLMRRGDRRNHVKTEAEMGRRQPQAQGRPEFLEAGRGRKDLPLEPPAGAQSCPVGSQQPCLAWISDVWSPGLGENRLLLF